MNTVHEIDEVRNKVKMWKREGLTVGLVPTMGFLHEGHESLIKRAVSENDKVVVSVFVNPAQFGPNEDFKIYPRDIERDAKLCECAGADLIFNPEPSTMYCEDASTTVNVKGLTEELCGVRRPVHFGGVCLVISKLFNIVTPDRAYFGEKDAQQLAVVKRMVRDLNFDVKIIGCPIVREADGLARSSRNVYLSEEERKAAVVLSRSLDGAEKALNSGERNASRIKEIISQKLNSELLARIDYVEVADSVNLKPVSGDIDGSVLVAIAVYIGKVRLIDNFTFRI
ncbi:MAG TPA: pantoate--beta-alanine ligase [Clostridium sp.]|jgi:pantoate--beta-alanine ligase|uniref:Pantothenate synthetase n=1 Tax=Clostridium lapidicellarium TaxID=3240931 RepID=A0ABV4DZC8_9CLOT|nr:pantoate--beta-alanine ligase [Clostridiales bacterium]HBC96960.1 pantoate--beta-alanine ligase [Clostridium sp.]